MFRRIVKILPAVCLTTGMARAAESPFIGEWKLDPSKSRLPDEMKVESEGGNKYAFDFGAGAEQIVVDGTDQPGNDGTLLSVNRNKRLFSTWERHTWSSCHVHRQQSLLGDREDDTRSRRVSGISMDYHRRRIQITCLVGITPSLWPNGALAERCPANNLPCPESACLRM